MRKSGRVSLGDFRRAYRLLDECRDVGDDPNGWPAVLAPGLARLVDAQVGVVGEFDSRPPDPQRDSFLVDHGWPSPELSERYRRTVMDEKVYLRSSAFQRITAMAGPIVTRSREQLIDDREWYCSWEYQNLNRPSGMDDQMASISYSGEPTTAQILIVFRPIGDRLFLPRERRLVRIFHHELSRHYGRSLRRHSAGRLESYPRRLRQTLRCLLEGDSEKQAAARLGLSRHTLHGYVVELRSRLGVGTRAELMAYCLRHHIRPDEASPPLQG